MSNIHLKNAEIARGRIAEYLPTDTTIDILKLNRNVQDLVNSTKHISTGIPLSMSSLIAQYTLANFTSQFQMRIDLDGTYVPVNQVCFLLASSGLGKDSTVNGQEKALNRGYLEIEQHRKETAEELARNKANEEEGDEALWKQFYKHPEPLSNSISTAEGLVSRLNNFSRAGIGMPSVYVGELGSELQSNPWMTDNIRLISELYDLGNKKSKAIKDAERQDQEVKGMGMCALFVGSEDNIILDKQVSQKFRIEYMTKLARRSITVYPSKEEFENSIIEYKDYEDMKTKQTQYKFISDEANASLGTTSQESAQFMLELEHKRVTIDTEAQEIIDAYKTYCMSIGAGKDYIHKTVAIEQSHRAWKTLKLAGTYALMESRDNINTEDIKEAMYFIEMVGPYLSRYEEHASKESYELMCEYFKANPSVSLNLHELKKREYITGSAGIDSKVKELVRLGDSFLGIDGYLKYEKDTIKYIPFEAVGDHSASYVMVQGSKDQRATMCHSGFSNEATTFEKILRLATNDTAYSPFKFAEGKRSNANIISGATWIALDIDDTDITIDEMHDALDGFNHHIVSTSDSSNPYKFRVILEFNNIVSLEPKEWKAFGVTLGKELGLNIDPATFTKSQIMFGYKGAKCLSCLDGEAYDISGTVKEATESVAEVFSNTTKPTITEKKNMLDNKLETFRYAFDCEDGHGSLALFRAYRHAFDLGINEEDNIALMNEINYDYWEESMSEERFENTIIVPLKRMYE